MLQEVLKTFNVDNSVFYKLQAHAMSRIIPLSMTKATPSMFFHWKKNGVISHLSDKTAKRTRVKLNLPEAIWVQFLLQLRNYGIQIEQLKEIHDEIFVTENIDFHQLMKDEIKSAIHVSNDLDFKSMLEELLQTDPQDYLEEEHKILYTTFGLLCAQVMLDGLNLIVLIYFDSLINKLKVSIEHEKVDSHEVFEFNKKIKSGSFISISIKNIIADIIGEEKLQPYLEEFEIFDDNEISILNELKKKNVKEIRLTKLNDEEFKMTIIENREIRGEEVKSLKKYFGLNNYKEVHITTRNDKHIILNKTSTHNIKYK